MKKCEKCEKEHDGSFGSGRFCCRSCANSRIWNNQNNHQRRSKLKGKNRGRSIKLTYEQNQKRIQSIKKYHKKKYEEYINKWIEGKIDGNTKNGYSKNLKKYFIEKYNNCCMKCGWSKINKYTNKVPLEMHHKDGNCYNNRRDNLEILCPSCHALTSNFKASNKNSARKYQIVYKN